MVFPGLFLQPLAVVANPCGFVNGLTRPFSRPGFYYLSESADYSALSTACT
ncbi:hypothetical protein [Morganella morganii IS15]|nr:hypothetical protein CSB69_1883 [Morganella morganii]EMP53549.1 hypothetical protein C790_00065 [Morganella morganii SC01]CDK68528.1 hypothetical protein [Morganella morganii IS15]